jgi:hypothetical protein
MTTNQLADILGVSRSLSADELLARCRAITEGARRSEQLRRDWATLKAIEAEFVTDDDDVEVEIVGALAHADTMRMLRASGIEQPTDHQYVRALEAFNATTEPLPAASKTELLRTDPRPSVHTAALAILQSRRTYDLCTSPVPTQSEYDGAVAEALSRGQR